MKCLHLPKKGLDRGEWWWGEVENNVKAQLQLGLQANWLSLAIFELIIASKNHCKIHLESIAPLKSQ